MNEAPCGNRNKASRRNSAAALTTLLVLFSLTLVPAAQSQSYDVTGVVVDSTGLALRGATVVAITASDSTLTSFGTTRANGDFQLRRVPSGDFILQVSFVGFDTYSTPISVASSTLDVGTITMIESVTELGELVVTEERIPIVVKADTVVYDASAFKVRPYATVEELLKRLPGIEVARDGTVTAQGEEVQKVLVDGKEFFGDDPKIATKNLPAEAVERVQVFDKKSDIAEFTGVDDGEEQKTINLELKEDHRQGYFGDVSAAYGADNRYDGRANINRFNSTTQAALIGSVSNVGNQGFSSDEFVEMAMVMGGGGGFSGGGSGGGLSTTASGGLNFSHDFNPRTSIRSSYFLNHADNTQDSELLQQQLFGNTLGSLMEETSNREAINFNHRLNLDVEHEFSDTKNLRFRFRGQASDTETLNLSSSETAGIDNIPVNNSNTTYNTQADRLDGNARLTYLHRFGQSTRNIVAEVRGDMNDQDSEADLESITQYFEDGSLLTTEELNQLQTSLSNDLTTSARLSFTQPLGGVRLLELRAERRQAFEDRTQSIFDRVGSDLIFNDSLSSGFDRTYTYNEGSAILRWDREDSDLSFGASVESSQLDGEVVDFGVPVHKSYVHVLPTAQYRSEVGRGMNVYVRYSAGTREPSIQQLQPVVDNSNPLRIYVGNPDLNPEYTHSIRSHFRWFDQFTFMNVFLSMNGSYTKNQIVNARTVDEQFRQTITPINADGDWSIGGSGSFGTPIRPLGVQINLSNRTNFGRSTEFVNGAENDTQTLRNSINVRLENRNKDKFDVGAGTQYTFNVNNYSLNRELNQNYVNRSYFADVAYTPTDNWRFSTGFDLAVNSEEVFGSSRNVAMWNAEISRSLLQNNRAQIVLTGRDLLNQSVGVDYTNAAGFVRQEEVRSLGRYFLLKFVYNLSATPRGGASRTVRMID